MIHMLLYAILPIVVIMTMGYISGKRGIFSDNDAGKFNRIVLDYALPAALFVSIIGADRHELANNIKVTIIATVGIMLCFMAVYLTFRLFKRNTGAEAAVSALGAGSPAIGFLGFAVLQPIFGKTAEVALIVAIVGIVVNAIGIPVGLSLLNASRRNNSSSPHTDSYIDIIFNSVLKALRQPVAWAPILAVVLVASGIRWSGSLNPTLYLIADANSFMAIFSIGITLSSIKIKVTRQVMLGTIFKMIIMPAVLLIISTITDIDRQSTKMLVIASALPPAFTGIIIAKEYNTYIKDSTSTLALSVLIFIPLCPIWLWILNHITP